MEIKMHFFVYNITQLGLKNPPKAWCERNVKKKKKTLYAVSKRQFELTHAFN